MQFKSKFLQTLSERGFIHQQTDAAGLDVLLVQQTPVAAYIGFDCTAKSLHVGSLLQIMALRWLQKTGHKPIVLLGGGTTKIGDPSGKDKSREMLTPERIEENKQGIGKVFAKYLEIETSYNPQSTKAFVVDNDEWLAGLKYIDVLREIGRHFSVNRMLTMESVKARLEREQHLSFLEFNYMILQSYDFCILKDKYRCRLQIGGSDQWGNIVMGTELHTKIRNAVGQEGLKHAVGSPTVGSSLLKEVQHLDPTKQFKNERSVLFGLTTPLITTSSGAKMGKTAEGAVWIDADMLSPYEYWQFWRNTDDADVGRWLRFFTELPLDKIQELEALEGSGINEAKKVLADEATTLAHGADAARAARETAEKTFEQGALGDDLPRVKVPRSELQLGIPAFQLLHRAELTASGGEARKLIQGGGARLNDEKITDEKRLITLEDLTEHGVMKLSAGKKKHVLVEAS
jgi:tyrosyl-tRNA synthetase